jgi:DNA-directed RNA polymerase subunit RPC12/RpoP
LKVEHALAVSTKLDNPDLGNAYSTGGPGINYVCAECGALLYHSGNDGAYENGAVSFPAKQPAEVASRLLQCPQCGHKLNSDPDPDSVRINRKIPGPSASRGTGMLEASQV